MARQKRVNSPQTDALGEKLGKTIQRLRMADQLSLGEHSATSGVAKSMISQIEKNETNPSLATLSRLSQALGTSVEAFLVDNNPSPLIEKLKTQDTPLLRSEDNLCELRIIGWSDSVQWAQWYDFKAKSGGKLESSPHPTGSVESLSILSGNVKVCSNGECWTAKAGETLRYRGDFEHSITNIGDEDVHATMVIILAHSIRKA